MQGLSAPAYAYALNNPIRWVDVNGLDPGDHFTSRDAAARDATRFSRKLATRDGVEYGGTIFKYEGGTYSYAYPNKGIFKKNVRSAVNTKQQCEDSTAKKVADYHVHLTENRFSTDDLVDANGNNLSAYLQTPSGDLLLYNPATLRTTSISP